MKILHISAQDLSGGAARAAHRLHRGLLAEGYDSSMYVQKRDSNEPEIYEFIPNFGFPARLRRALRARRNFQRFVSYTDRPKGLELFSFESTSAGREMAAQIRDCDVVNLHWVAGFLDYPSFFPYWHVIGKPLIWTLHDLNPMTGGCHYDRGCGKYRDACKACPQLGSEDPHDLSARIFARKKDSLALLDEAKTRVVGPSHWITNEAKQSRLLGRFSASVIPNGLDASTYIPRDRAHCRSVLGLPPDARVLLFAADDIHNERKGFAFAVEIALKLGDVLICTFGRGRAEVPADVNHIHFGSVSSDIFMSILFSAADVFLITSIQDNLPNMVMEAMACGVPVAGFDVGGISDMVRRGETGILAAPADVERLSLQIKNLMNDSDLWNRMRANSRAVVESEYTIAMQARRYAELYINLL